MLQLTGHNLLNEESSRAALQPESEQELVAAFRQNWRLMLACVAISLVIALVIIATSRPVYIGSTRILFDPRRAEPYRQSSDRELAQFSIDTAQLESQIQLLRSEQVSRAVIEAHRLDQDPEFTNPAPSLRSFLHSMSAKDVPSPAVYSAVSNEFDSRLDVRRLGQSYVLQVSFQSADPLKAAKLANAVTAAYIGKQISSRIESAVRSSQFERPIRELSAEGVIVTEAIKSGKIDIDNFPAADARVISGALTPTGPSAPRTSLIAGFSLCLGLLTGGFLALLRHRRRKAIRLRSQVERQLGVNYLGSFHALKSQTPRPRSKAIEASERWGVDLMGETPAAPFGTSLRTIRTSFEMQDGHRGGQCIGVTSANAGEGKSQVALGLALSFAAAGRKTLLIDANPRNPTLSERLAVHLKTRSTTGFVQVLAGEQLSAAISPALAKNLSFMPVGHEHELANFSDVFDTPEALELFKRLREQYDRVIIDLPGFSVLPDAWAIGTIIDSYILVIEAGRTRHSEATQMISALKFANAGIAGAVLNERRS
jgi:succinoglycan biosynthesis transport protein ExoP